MTIVAAWMRAETGVGPAIASGSQTKRGIWALLPVAPTKRARHANVISPPAAYVAGLAAAAANIFPKSTVPNIATQAKSPRRNPASPIRFMTNAFLPASAAKSFVV